MQKAIPTATDIDADSLEFAASVTAEVVSFEREYKRSQKVWERKP